TDRLKDMYICGGFNCYPAEIENLLLGHPDIAEVAVIGTPDERLGEVGHAFVMRKPGSAPEPGALIEWARERMANFKAPRHVSFLEELPRNATGKVQKFLLRRG
ncbi:MAG: fatty acid--CoA ligase, partial [Gammaproteobacteria bacterium]|nr:fatty acid--CoA ligase [Gammaproteobacteria bacterium]